jgi:RimJ/RimL family protein N-acetyltransferase
MLIDYPIRTERLQLRPVTLDDVPAMHAYQSLPEVCRYVPFEPRTREQIAERITTGVYRATMEDEGQALTLGVVLPEAGVVIGDLMLAWRSREHGTAEIGYAFHPDFGAHGYASEAVAALLALAFGTYRFHRAIARIDARNTKSANLVRRLGLRQEAHLLENEWFKGEWSDELDFAILASEWSRD